MRDRKFENRLRQLLGEPVKSDNAEETVRLCTAVMRETQRAQETRTGFLQYLSDIFRYEGISIVGLQALTLLAAVLEILFLPNALQSLPVITPLFALAAVPSLFRGRTWGMCEMEAATRSSGAQLMLAKLILAGAANLICMTGLLCLEISLQSPGETAGQMILYILVPYLLCMVLMLRCARLRTRGSAGMCAVIALGSCAGWGILAGTCPWLYRMSVMGVWIIAFLLSLAFYMNEIYYIAELRRKGKMYGTIA